MCGFGGVLACAHLLPNIYFTSYSMCCSMFFEKIRLSELYVRQIENVRTSEKKHQQKDTDIGLEFVVVCYGEVSFRVKKR